MGTRKARPSLVSQRFNQTDRECLMLAILTVLKGQIHEVSLCGSHIHVETKSDDLFGQTTRDGITGEHTRRAAEHIARELVKDDYPRQQRVRAGEAAGVAHHDELVHRKKPCANSLVEVVTCGPPELFAELSEPEVKHLGDPWWCPTASRRVVIGHASFSAQM